MSERAGYDLELVRSQISNLNAQTAEIQQRMKYQIWIIGAAYVGALIAIVKVL